MSNSDKMTPPPWAVEEIGVDEFFIVKPDSKGGWWPVAEMSKDGAFADANLIVKAVNSFSMAQDLAKMVGINCRSYCGPRCIHKTAHKLLSL